MTEQLESFGGEWVEVVHTCPLPPDHFCEVRVGKGSVWQCKCGKRWLWHSAWGWQYLETPEELAERQEKARAALAADAERQAAQTKPNPWRLWHRS